VRRRLLMLPLLVSQLLMGGCSLIPKNDAPSVTVYDFGPPAAGAAPARAPVIQPVTVPPWLEGRRIDYRLDYRDASQRASYRDSRWAADAAALVTERLRQRAARAGEQVGAQTLRVELEEFCHVFASPQASRGLVVLRANIVDAATGQSLRRRVFEASVDAPSADAAGGAHALAQATDRAIEDVLGWAAAGR
jgi:cholesterol transport system auxiliary component